MTKTLISSIAALSLLLSWLTPHHYYPWLTGDSEFLAFGAALILSLVIFHKKIIIPHAAALFACTAAIPVIQWMFGIVFFSGDAILSSCYLIGFSLVILIGYNLTQNEPARTQSYQALAYLFIIGSTLSVVIAFRQWLGLSQGFSFFEAASSGSRPFANFGQPNNLATLLCMGLASTLFLFEQRRFGRVIASLFAVCLIFGVALTQSRTAWVGSVFALAWWFWKSQNFNPRLSWQFMTGWLCFYVICIISLPLLTPLVTHGHSAVSLATSIQKMDNGRGLLWQQFATAVLHGPLWGYGWNQVSVAQVTVSNLFPVSVMTTSSHNILLDLLVWNGPLLGSLIIIMAMTWLVRLAYCAKSLTSVYALLAVGFALIHGMLEYPLEYAYFLLPVGLLLGMVYGEVSSTQKYIETLPISKYLSRLPRLSGELPRTVFASFLAICTVFMIWLGYEYHTLNRDYRAFKPSKLTPNKASTAIYNPDHIIVLTQLRDYLQLQSINPTPNMTEQQLDWAREVAYRFPQVENLARYATALALNNQPIQAGQELSELRILYGNHVFTEAAEALTALQQEYADQATAAYRRCHHRHHDNCSK
ncbi:MAG: O-antigen ligase C-terminal domain-containing protein [Gammaproteobacteria bacterium]|nr:O-antigen ligase C-terminal domain-containing protein [Gammaproteobacteria bacterium]